MSNKFTQCAKCGVILEPNYDLDENTNMVILCEPCFNMHLLANSTNLTEGPDERVLH